MESRWQTFVFCCVYIVLLFWQLSLSKTLATLWDKAIILISIQFEFNKKVGLLMRILI